MWAKIKLLLGRKTVLDAGIAWSLAHAELNPSAEMIERLARLGSKVR